MSKFINSIKEKISRLGIIKEFFYFFKYRKAWWLAPIIILLLILGILIIWVEGSAIAPFIYTLF
jgi:hypothetical protein